MDTRFVKKIFLNKYRSKSTESIIESNNLSKSKSKTIEAVSTDLKTNESTVGSKSKEIKIINYKTTKNNIRNHYSIQNMKSSSINNNGEVNKSKFTYLLKVKNIEKSFIKWTFDLRTDTSNNSSINNKFLSGNHEPSFYNDDLNKIIKKRKLNTLSRVNSCGFISEDKSIRLTNLLENGDRHGKNLNTSQINFATSLRPEDLKQKNILQWKKVSDYNVPKKGFLPPIYIGDMERYVNIRKLIPKKYKYTFDKVDFDGKKLLKKSLVENTKEISDEPCEHLSRAKFNGIFKSKNMQAYRYLLKNKDSFQTISYQNSLRSFGNETFCPYKTIKM